MSNSQSRVLKKVYCKKAKVSDKSVLSYNLRDLVISALSRLPKANQRRESINSENTQFRLINNFAMSGNALCGVMLTYEKDANALALAEDENAESYSIEQLVPLAKDGKRREFLEGLLYFAIQGNAVAIIQSKSLRSLDLERHLYWLLQEAAPDGVATLFSLTDAISENIRARVDKSHVKCFEMGSQLVVPKDHQGKTVDRSKLKSSVDYGIGGLGVDILKALESYLPKQLNLKDALDENIDLTLRIKYNRTIGHKGQSVLDTLAMALRNIDDSDSKITLNDGGEIYGDELKLKANVKVGSLNGVLLPDSVFSELSNLLDRFIKSGDIVV